MARLTWRSLELGKHPLLVSAEYKVIIYSSDFASFNLTTQRATPNPLASKHLSSTLHAFLSYAKGESHRAVMFQVIDLTNEHVAVFWALEALLEAHHWHTDLVCFSLW